MNANLKPNKKYIYFVRSMFPSPSEQSLLVRGKSELGLCLERVEHYQYYTFTLSPQYAESVGEKIEQDLQYWAKIIFTDPIIEEGFWKLPAPSFASQPHLCLKIAPLPGVTDNLANTATEALGAAGYKDIKVATGQLYYLYGDINGQQAQLLATEFLANPLLHEISINLQWSQLSQEMMAAVAMGAGLVNGLAAGLPTGAGQSSPPQKITAWRPISLEGSNEFLQEISKQNLWALSLMEMLHIRQYFAQEEVRRQRQQKGLPAQPTDVEMEILAQTWSEHCKHKIFNAHIHYTDREKGEELEITSLYRTYIQGATQTILKERGIDWAISLFTDNAGIVRFDPQVDVCVKVETHNGPAALDPYGGALTGILGVNRDILGCGMGAKPIANMDVFCFADPQKYPLESQQSRPVGVKSPRQIWEGVFLGVEDGGNKSGIPTINGSFTFHDGFLARPLVYCGTVGVLPQHLPGGRSAAQKHMRPEDLVVVIGGAVGKDGIHGATFSSLSLEEGTPSTVVQVGDPLTQKRVADFLLEARDLDLFSAVTDNGAGGLSSSVGECAQMTGGAVVELAHCPLKYPGILPWEIMVSESQERMTLAVPEEKWPEFHSLAQRRGVAAHCLGRFHADGALEVYYHGECVAFLPLEFLHESLPKLHLEATWQRPQVLPLAAAVKVEKFAKANGETRGETSGEDGIAKILLALLSSPNIRSKENWVRRFDFEVQGATCGKPFTGPTGMGPSDGGVLWMGAHGGDPRGGLCLSHGLAPKYTVVDPYYMACLAVDEAVRNNVASGGDPQKMALLDNFCWPDPVASGQNPDGAFKLAQLVQACQGLYKAAVTFGTPLVSGKDSMKNDYVGNMPSGEKVKLSIPPTLLVTALGHVPDIEQRTSMEFKEVGDIIFLLGDLSSSGLLCSELQAYNGYYGLNVLLGQEQMEQEVWHKLPELNLEKNQWRYQRLAQWIQQGRIASCHDISDGGLLVSVVESMLGAGLGAKLNIVSQNILDFCFNEGGGRFVLSMSPQWEEAWQREFSGETLRLGEVQGAGQLDLSISAPAKDSQKVGNFILSQEELLQHWRGNL